MTTAPVLSSRQQWLEAFEGRKSHRENEPSWLGAQRQSARGHFADHGFPSIREEAWRFTNVAPIARTTFELADGDAALTAEHIAPFAYSDMARVVCVDGVVRADLSELDGLPVGVWVGSLAQAIAEGRPRVEAHLGRLTGSETSAFLDLNTALFLDGLVVEVPRGVVVETPIQLLWVSTSSGQPRAQFPRGLIVLDEAAQATVLESFVGLGDSVYFTAPVTEIVVADGAVLEHYRLQQESPESYHVSMQKTELGRSSTVSSHTISLLGGLIRNNVVGVLGGEGGNCELNGLYLTAGHQHVDNQMRVDHVAAHCYSHELYKGILDGKSRAVFNGLIHVFDGAQKTDAVQTNRNLLLSDEARANTNPQLEIYADDVKCTHGSTVGQLDDEAVFYLRSRGIGALAARSLLTWAFAAEVVERIKLPALRRDLEEFLLDRLPRGEVVRQAI